MYSEVIVLLTLFHPQNMSLSHQDKDIFLPLPFCFLFSYFCVCSLLPICPLPCSCHFQGGLDNLLLVIVNLQLCVSVPT